MTTRRAFLATSAATAVLAAANLPADPVSRPASNEMTSYKIPRTDLTVSRIAYGCAKLISFDRTELSQNAVSSATRAIAAAYDKGITFFDLADQYGFFKAEAAFGRILKQSPGLRNNIVIQSKCGVRWRDDWASGRPSYFLDCSYQSIVESVEGSLRRLQTEHLDLLLLHFPDALIEPEEVAKAFDELKSSGKVRHFGVSNHTASQIELLAKYVRQPLVTNQVGLGLSQASIIADGLRGNKADSQQVTGVIDYCRLNSICIQAFAVFGRDLIDSQSNATREGKEIAQVIRQIADRKNATPWVVALAWVLRHPAEIVPIIGSTNPKHIAENCSAVGVTLDRDDWYRLLVAATNAADA